MQTVAVIQARMSSSRFPGKVIADLDGLPMVVFMARRVARARRLDRVILATSIEDSDTPLATAAEAHGLEVYRGPLDDVLGRFGEVQALTGADVLVRLTGDCPLADPDVIDALIDLRASTGADYASNVEPRSFAHGLDCEIFTKDALVRAVAIATSAYDREHVTPWMRTDAAGLVRANLVAQDADTSGLRLTVDHPADLEVVRAVVAGTGPEAPLAQIAAWLGAHPEIAALNAAHR
ncbi:MAG: glycosyltransferase family protein [Jannaschia sp.]